MRLIERIFSAAERTPRPDAVARLGCLFSWIGAYARADDPLTAASNFIALIVVANQPFYPLYVRFFVGDDGWVSLMTFFSTPFFLAVPAVARISSLAGRAMLPIVGVLNTLFCAKIFGQASGVELFLCPCAMIAGMALRANERKSMLAILGLAFGGFLALHNRYGAPLHLFSDAEYARFLSMNAVSVGALIGLVALQYSSALAKRTF
jgi:hypothetical protein